MRHDGSGDRPTPSRFDPQRSLLGVRVVLVTTSAHCHLCAAITRPTSDAVLARAVPIRAHRLLDLLELLDVAPADPCDGCGAVIGEPCLPSCTGLPSRLVELDDD